METLAFDLGASGGRTVLGRFNGQKLSFRLVHRFSNDPVWVCGRFQWDILRLYHEIKLGLMKANVEKAEALSSMAIDSWALDFGLLGDDGGLLGNPFHYRDPRNEGMMEEVFKIIPRQTIFRHTGIQFMQINSLYQLFAMKQGESALLKNSSRLLMIPDLLRYFLTGELINEYTNATTTQLVDHKTGQWQTDMIHKLGFPERIFGSLVKPGVSAGMLQAAVCSELSIDPIRVVTVGEHDTASAVVAVPTISSNFAYLSCGTWSLLGTEVVEPVISDLALQWNFTNEGGIGGTYRLLKNMMGLWLIQECKRVWAQSGKVYSYPELALMAEKSTRIRMRSFIDPDAPEFLNPVHMPEQIQLYCRNTQQPIPGTEGEIVGCIMESLALKSRLILQRTEQLSGKHFAHLHIVGGGANNALLCQMIANAFARPVLAGPVEATAIGNLMMQYVALGEIGSISDVRRIIADSVEIREFTPMHTELWNEAYGTYLSLIHES
jgi:rhamnulokinase